MHDQTYRDAALLLVGHGSTKNANSRAATLHQAETLRQRGLFARVEAAFWQQSPPLLDVFHSLQAPRIFIIPLFLSKGYFTEHAIPESLGIKTGGSCSFSRLFHRPNGTCYYGYPVGTHPKITDLLLRRAHEMVTNHPAAPPPEPSTTALCLAGHGTPRDRRSREALEVHAGRIRQLGFYETVQTIYLEEEPRIEDCYRLTQAQHLVVVPFFLSDGLHVQEDIPLLLGAQSDEVKARLATGQNPWQNPSRIKGRLVWYAPGLGNHPFLGDIILERVREIAAVTPATAPSQP